MKRAVAIFGVAAACLWVNAEAQETESAPRTEVDLSEEHALTRQVILRDIEVANLRAELVRTQVALAQERLERRIERFTEAVEMAMGPGWSYDFETNRAAPATEGPPVDDDP